MMKAAGRVKRPSSKRTPPASSIRPAKPTSENSSSLSNIATCGTPRSFVVPCRRNIYAVTMRSSACARGVQVPKKASFRAMAFSSSAPHQRPRGRFRLQGNVLDAEALVQPLLQLGAPPLPLPHGLDDHVRRQRGAAARQRPDVKVVHRQHAIDARHLAADVL